MDFPKVNGLTLLKIAANDYRHDAKVPKPTPPVVREILKATFPVNVVKTDAYKNLGIVDEKNTMKAVFPDGADGAEGSTAPGDNLNTWRDLPLEGPPVRWNGNNATWGKFDYTIERLGTVGSLNKILSPQILNLVVDTKTSSVSSAAEGVDRVTWVETVETLHDPAKKNAKTQSKNSAKTYWGREDPKHLSFFPSWTEELGSVEIKNILPPSKMFFSKFDISLYKYNRTSYMHYYSRSTDKSILIEGTCGVSDLTASNPNMWQCAAVTLFTQFRDDTIKPAMKSLNDVFKKIKNVFFKNGNRNRNRKKNLNSELKAEFYQRAYFMVGKRLGDQGQALACLRKINITEYGQDNKVLPNEVATRAARPTVNVFVTIDRLAFLAALYYRVPAAIFCWGKKSGENAQQSAFIAYRTDLATPRSQFKYLKTHIADLKTHIAERGLKQKLPNISIFKNPKRQLSEKINLVITKAEGDLKKAAKYVMRGHTKHLTVIYKNLLGLISIVEALQKFKNATVEYKKAKMYAQELHDAEEAATAATKRGDAALDSDASFNAVNTMEGVLISPLQKYYDMRSTYSTTLHKIAGYIRTGVKFAALGLENKKAIKQVSLKGCAASPLGAALDPEPFSLPWGGSGVCSANMREVPSTGVLGRSINEKNIPLIYY